MGRRISEKTKEARGMGKGTGADYKPYITTSEFSSKGTTAVIVDWKTGRGVHCLSQGEAMWYYILRWDDNNVDIREQFPLDYDETVEIARAMKVRPPRHTMTTDFLVISADNTITAYSVKYSRDLNERTLQRMCIEKAYWINRNARHVVLFTTDVDEVLYSNIRLVTEFYNPGKVFDRYSAIKHKLAVKEIKADLSEEILTTEVLDRLVIEQND